MDEMKEFEGALKRLMRDRRKVVCYRVAQVMLGVIGVLVVFGTVLLLLLADG